MDFRPSKRGALEAYLVEMNSLLRERGVHVCYLFSGPPAPWFEEEVGPNATVFVTNGNPLAGRNFCKTLKIVWRVKPNLVSFWFISLFSWKTLFLTRLPFIAKSVFVDQTSANASEKKGLLAVAGFLRGRLASHCFDSIVSASEFNRRRNVKRNYIDPAKTTVIYNGVKTTLAAEQAVVPSVRGPYILFAGQLIREQGVHTLVAAFARFITTHPAAEVHLVLVGAGAERDALCSESERLGISHRVEMLGLRDDVPALMRRAEVVIVPSEWPEAFGFVAAEAMAAGCPVIVSNAGALPEVAGDCGLVFEKGNVEALAGLLETVLSERNREEISVLAGRARARAEKVFSLTRMTTEYVNLFLH
jgi:glycosyltransferase involved in cell wall biosynthesis